MDRRGRLAGIAGALVFHTGAGAIRRFFIRHSRRDNLVREKYITPISNFQHCSTHWKVFRRQRQTRSLVV
jgi:hypothetical protein